MRIEAGDGRIVPYGEVSEEWQEQTLRKMDRAWQAAAGIVDEDVAPSRPWWELPRGHAKSTMTALQSLWCVLCAPKPVEGAVCAASRDQARILRDISERIVSYNPWLQSILDVQRDVIRNSKTGSTLSILSSDHSTAYGRTDAFIVADELCHWPADKGEKLWHTLLSTIAKRRRTVLTVLTNAGFNKGEGWQWLTRENCRMSDEWQFQRVDKCVASWITEFKLQEQQALLPSAVFRRLWLNEWTETAGDVLLESDIQRAIKLTGPQEPDHERFVYCAGLDLSLRRHHSACAILGVDRVSGHVQLADLLHWRPADFLENEIQLDQIEKEILAAHSAFCIRRLVADPWQGQHLLQRLRARGMQAEDVTLSSPSIASRMVTSLVERFCACTIAIPPHGQLLTDLRGLRAAEGARGTLKLEATESIDGSHGDCAMALALALLIANRQTLINDDPIEREYKPLRVEPFDAAARGIQLPHNHRGKSVHFGVYANR